MMSLTSAFGASATPKSARVRAQASPLSFSLLPSTRSASAIAAKVCGSVCAAQPVTTIFADGRSRRRARMVCRACRTASAVTAQVLTTTVSLKPARSASRRITSDSAALSLQPKVTTSTPMGLDSPYRGEQRRIEAAAMLVFDWPGHQHMVVALAPFDGKIAARQRDGNLPAGPREPRGRNGGSAGRRAASLGEASAALPGANDDTIARGRGGECNVSPLREEPMVLKLRPDPAQIVGVRVVDPENRVRVAHVHDRRRAQDRRTGRPELQIDRAGIGHRAGQWNLIPAKARRAHIDCEQPVRSAPARNRAGRGFKIQLHLAGLGADERGDAAHTVAASTGLRAVVIVNPDQGVAAASPRIERHELVVRLLPGCRPRFARRDRLSALLSASAQIDYHDLVAETVHLDVVAIGQRAHDNARMCELI